MRRTAGALGHGAREVHAPIYGLRKASTLRESMDNQQPYAHGSLWTSMQADFIWACRECGTESKKTFAEETRARAAGARHFRRQHLPREPSLNELEVYPL